MPDKSKITEEMPIGVFIVGAEEYVFRTRRKNLRDLGVAITGHAPPHWKPPFLPARGTTHILICADDCPGYLAAHARLLEHQMGLTVVSAPLRNKWGETEEILRKHGLIEAFAGLPHPTVPPPADQFHPKLGDLVKAHEARRAEERPTVPEMIPPPAELPARPAPPEPAPPAPPAPTSEPTPTPMPMPEPSPAPSPSPSPAPVATPEPPSIMATKSMKTPRAVVIEILRETEGQVGVRDLMVAIRQETGETMEERRVRELAADVRQKHGLPTARRGLRPPNVRALLARYGIVKTDGAEMAKRSAQVRLANWAAAGKDKRGRTPEAPAARASALPASASLRGGKARAAALSPERRAEIARNAAVARWSQGNPQPQPKAPAPPKQRRPAAAAPSASDGFPQAIRAALEMLRATLEPFGVVRLELLWTSDDGWKVPRVIRERRIVTSEEIDL